jgi:hypothetical protein
MRAVEQVAIITCVSYCYVDPVHDSNGKHVLELCTEGTG